MNREDLISVREGLEDDFNFIMATFLRGLYYGASAFSPMDKSTFMTHYHKIVVGLLASPKVKVKAACLKEDPSVVLAYSIISTDETVLHWVFTKKSWRKIGLAKLLVPSSTTSCTHLTALGSALKKKIEFNPFKL